LRPLLFLLLITLAATPAAAGSVASLQVLIEQTPEGEVVQLEPGIYAGPVIIEKAVILDGKGQVTIDGQGKGSVLLVSWFALLEIGYSTIKLKIPCSGLTFRKPTRT
jgi:nitrous oxidase accessory protein